MDRLRQTLRLALFAVVLASVAMPVAPAIAAPGDVEAEIFLRNLTLPAGGDAVEESLSVLLLADEPGWADEVTMSVDLSDVEVADVDVTGPCSAGPTVRCVLPGPHRVFERPDGDGAFGYVTFEQVSLTLTPKAGASVGDAGTLTVTARADDGPTTTRTATVRLGEGVNLTAVDDALTVAPGGTAELRPTVRNSGPTAVDAPTAVIYADEGVLAGTDFGNCTYGYWVACTFDTSLTAGSTYRVSAPLTVEAPRDAVAGSQASLGLQWLTAAEWEDWQADYDDHPEGRPGAGPDLLLEEISTSAAGTPQADTDRDDNGSAITVTVSGARRTDVVAVGAAIPGRPGVTHAIEVGLVNRGPGTLRYPPFANNVTPVSVVLPAGVSVVTADERCTSLADDISTAPPSSPAEAAAAEFFCMSRSPALGPGQRLMFAFEVRMDRPGRESGDGSVQVGFFDEEGIDRDAGNNRAPITVSAAGGGGGLPITGAAVSWASGIGTLLVLIGTALVLALRRREAGAKV